jgi:hypothetical protein
MVNSNKNYYAVMNLGQEEGDYVEHAYGDR